MDFCIIIFIFLHFPSSDAQFRNFYYLYLFELCFSCFFFIFY